jgi:hypothetical protein
MMAEFIGLMGLGITLIFTQYVTYRSTQKIITEVVIRVVGEMNRNTQCTLQKILKLQKETHRILVATHELQKSNQRIIGEVLRLQKSMNLCLRKIDLGMRANALMHGWQRLDNVSPARVRQLPEPKVYDPELKVCYFKPS